MVLKELLDIVMSISVTCTTCPINGRNLTMTVTAEISVNASQIDILFNSFV